LIDGRVCILIHHGADLSPIDSIIRRGSRHGMDHLGNCHRRRNSNNFAL